MPRYEVKHAMLMSQDMNKAKRRGDIVTAADLKDAGHDVDFLLKNDAIEVLRGSEHEKDADPATVDAFNAAFVEANKKAAKDPSPHAAEDGTKMAEVDRATSGENIAAENLNPGEDTAAKAAASAKR